MFKVYISESAYQAIVGSTTTEQSYLKGLNGRFSALLVSINQAIEDFRSFYATLSSEAEYNTNLYTANGERMKRCMGVRNLCLNKWPFHQD